MEFSDETQGDSTPSTPAPLPSEPEPTALGSTDYTYTYSQPGHAPTVEIPPSADANRAVAKQTPSVPARASKAPPPPPPPPPSDNDDEPDDEERGMLRMSFLEHLEELRRRIIYAIIGTGVAFLISFSFCKQLWSIVAAPAVDALTRLGLKPDLVQITPMENFNVIWVKVPLLCSVFIASPWLLYQVWAFIAPGLYKRERKWAAPFVISTAGLFILGGLFAYFVAFRYGLVFLLGIGRDVHVAPMVSINEYFDLFVNVTLGIGLVFELPILIFFLTLLRIVTPKFLISNSRYAILIITVVAAIVTPTPDVFNLLLFATPMIFLFFVGVFASYILVLSREGRRFPWGRVLLYALPFVALLGLAAWFLFVKFHYHLLGRWPFLSK